MGRNPAAETVTVIRARFDRFTFFGTAILVRVPAFGIATEARWPTPANGPDEISCRTVSVRPRSAAPTR